MYLHLDSISAIITLSTCNRQVNYHIANKELCAMRGSVCMRYSASLFRIALRCQCDYIARLSKGNHLDFMMFLTLINLPSLRSPPI